jgi:hypothetical protein
MPVDPSYNHNPLGEFQEYPDYPGLSGGAPMDPHAPVGIHMGIPASISAGISTGIPMGAPVGAHEYNPYGQSDEPPVYRPPPAHRPPPADDSEEADDADESNNRPNVVAVIVRKVEVPVKRMNAAE